MKIVSLDPGATTGVCIYDTNKLNEFVLDQITTVTGDDFNRFYRMLTRLYNTDDFLLIIEQFNFRMNERDRTKINYVPREVIGVAKLWAAQNDVTIEMQMAAEGKAFWDDNKLSRIGLRRSGTPHALDALRHMLQYVTFTLKDQSYLMQLHPSHSSRTF